MDDRRQHRILRRTARVLRRVVVVLGWLLLAVVAVLVLALALPPARRALLDAALDQARTALPAGELTVGEADWPGLGRLVLLDVAWRDGEVSLAAVDSVIVDVATGDLLRRDLTVNTLLLAGVEADVPAIQRRLPAAPPDTVAADDGAGGPPTFPRAGALAPLPSVAVHDLDLRRVRLAATESVTATLEALALVLDLRRGHDARVDLGFHGRPLPDLGVAWRLVGQAADDSLRVDLAPLNVVEGRDAPPFADLPLSGALVLARADLDSLLAGRLVWPHLDLRGLEIAGDLGAWRIALDLDGREPGRLDLRSRLPEAPATLLAGLARAGLDTLAPGVLDTLSRRWGRGATPGFRLTAAFTPPADGAPLTAAAAEADGEVVLPAPAALAPLLPEPLRVDDWGPIIATLEAAIDARRDPPSGRLRLDLGRTPWLDTAVVSLHGDTSAIAVDTLALRLPGLALAASGRVDRRTVTLDATLDVPDSTLLARWDDPALAGLRVRTRADLAVAGDWPLPKVDLQARAMVEGPHGAVPHLDASVLAGPDTIDVAIALPEGARQGARSLDATRFTFAGAAGDSFRTLRGRLGLASGSADLDLELLGRLDARDLRTAPAGTLTVDSLGLRLDDLDLASEGPWGLAFSAADSSATVDGFHLAGRLGRIDLSARASPDTLAATLDADLEIDLTALATVLPDAVSASLPAATLLARASLAAAGTPRRPWATGAVHLGFRDADELEPLAARVDLAVAGRGGAPAGLGPPEVAWRERSARLRLSLAYADTALASVRLLAPLPVPDAPADSVVVALDADRTDLARLRPLLPPGVSVRGRFSADTRLAGIAVLDTTPPDLDLDGGFSLADARIELPDGSWLAMAGSVRLSGTSLSPEIEGSLDLDSGLIRLPDPPPQLLPTSGEAMLWEAVPATADSTVVAADTTDTADPLVDIVPELEFRVDAPGDLWLRGQGIDVELAGNLVLRLRDGRPALEGQLKAVQGSMRQLGHVFTLEEGRITFYADEEELDPQLDIVMGVSVQDYAIDIVLRGTANEPDLDFRSEPPLEDGDIMSLLLFGRTADQLNEGQAGFLAERAGELAAAYGSVQLQESLARELGVDVLTIAPATDGDDGTALTVGKYLSPKVLVRYEQVLEEASAFYVHLDYSFWRNFKLHTQVSQGQASGAEVKWERDW